MLEPKEDGSNKDEGEITGGKRLIKKLYKQYHHFADIIVADALYYKSTWIKEVLSICMNAVTRVKDERLHIVKYIHKNNNILSRNNYIYSTF
jgi:hypothetical protein